VTLTRADLNALLEAELEAPAPIQAGDLTVEQVAVEMRRSPSTVRGWLIAGELKGYKLNRRDWRVPRSALRDYVAAQQKAEPSTAPAGPVDISAWRKVQPRSRS
jgi:excisionase family DNA binding protein